MPRNVIIGTVIVLIIIVIIVCMRSMRGYDALPGFYTGDADFCAEASLKRLHFHFAKPPMFSKTYTGYVLMEAPQCIIANTSLKMRISEQWFCGKNWVSPNIRVFNMTLIDDDSILPKYMQLEYDLRCSRIRLYNNGELFARMYKDGRPSDLCVSG